MRTFIFACVACFMIGCDGYHCIKFNGTYQEISGGVEYCFSKELTEQNSRPTYVNGDQKIIALPEQDIEKIAQKIEELSTPQASKIKISSDESPMKRLLKLIQKKS